MKSISKANGSRLHPATRGNVSLAHGRKAIQERDEQLSDAIGVDWEAADEDLDLEHLDVEALEDRFDDDASTDWVADRDFALQIARGALH